MRYLTHEADLIILLGASFNERTSYTWTTELLNGKRLIQVDRNLMQLEKGFKANVAVQSDLFDYLRSMNAYCAEQAIEEAQEASPDLEAFKRTANRSERRSSTRNSTACGPFSPCWNSGSMTGSFCSTTTSSLPEFLPGDQPGSILSEYQRLFTGPCNPRPLSDPVFD